jgi:hypothetical protein
MSKENVRPTISIILVYTYIANFHSSELDVLIGKRTKLTYVLQAIFMEFNESIARYFD